MIDPFHSPYSHITTYNITIYCPLLTDKFIGIIVLIALSVLSLALQDLLVHRQDIIWLQHIVNTKDMAS